MKIETYEIEPPSSEIGQLAADGEARMICEKLGLRGQLALADNESQTPFPYRRMSLIEQRVFEYHCPVKTPLNDYRSDAIPVRVLQVASHALDCNVLKRIEIWHPKEAKLDPVLVGIGGEYGMEPFLLARWGAVWKEFAVLLDEAKRGWVDLRRARLERAVRETQKELDNVEQIAVEYFSGEHVETSVYF